ncbi:SURF1 family protein [Vibrio rumoiensis]|uniref:SURF1-like protein n=1 Tax=Vibrio rumoiensis 1S-45 TaxID=1188252 RepID=A0A1E5E4Y5_9VIBR|nr:SURF1 family protein [Vibrio rumoiensis]OEF28189.1 hypothetical protein A1QC_05990 [Vibrio rumoiensis 1S-45]
MGTKISIKKIFLIVVTVALFMLMVKLGFWQLDRGHQKLAMEQALEQRMSERPIPLTDWQDDKSQPQTGIKVELTVTPFFQQAAQQLAEQQTDQQNKQSKVQDVSSMNTVPNLVFLDNQTYEGKVGYLVFQLIDVSELSDYAVALLELGFVPGSRDRRVLPPVGYVVTPQRIEGRLYRRQDNPMSRGLMVEKMTTQAGQAVLRIQNLSMNALESRWDKTLFPYAIQPLSLVKMMNVDGEVSKDLPHPWKPVSMASDKHIGYAIQWFSMAAVLLMLACWFGYKLYRQSRHSAKILK